MIAKEDYQFTKIWDHKTYFELVENNDELE